MAPTLRYGVTSSCGHGFLVGPAGERERARARAREREGERDGNAQWCRSMELYMCALWVELYMCALFVQLYQQQLYPVCKRDLR